MQVPAREVSGEERDGLWVKAVELDPAYAVYQERTDRKTAALMLEPVEDR